MKRNEDEGWSEGKKDQRVPDQQRGIANRRPRLGFPAKLRQHYWRHILISCHQFHQFHRCCLRSLLALTRQVWDVKYRDRYALALALFRFKTRALYTVSSWCCGFRTLWIALSAILALQLARSTSDKHFAERYCLCFNLSAQKSWLVSAYFLAGTFAGAKHLFTVFSLSRHAMQTQSLSYPGND